MKEIDGRTIKEIQDILITWERDNYHDFPWRRTESKFHALIAEVMLHKTRAEQVAPIYQIFIKRYPTLEHAIEEDHDRIRELLKPLGLRWRAEKILEILEVLDKKGGTVPESMNKLLELPGVGQYAASAFLSFHCGVRAPIADTNAVRLWSRIFGFQANKGTYRSNQFLELIERLTPTKRFKEFNLAILDFSRTICRTKPLCQICPLFSLCEYVKR